MTALTDAIASASAAAAAFSTEWNQAQAAYGPMKNAGDALGIECWKAPPAQQYVTAGDKARKDFEAALGAANAALGVWTTNVTKAAQAALAYVPPPPPQPPPPPPPTTTPSVYGCPDGTALKTWQFAMVTGGGAPAGVPPWQKGARISGVRFKGIESKGWYSENGICTGAKGYSEDIIVSDSIIEESAKWKARAHKNRGTRFLRVSFLRGPEEHDVYGEPVGGQPMTAVCLSLEDCYSERSGSQVLQTAQRTEDGVSIADYVEGGLILVLRTKAVDHARHKLEGGTGTRQSQAFKVFSAQIGPDEAHRVNRMLLHWVLFKDSILDDSMQKWSHGFALIGANLGSVITGCTAKMGSLTSPKPDDPTQTQSQEAIRVESFIPGTDGSQCGPLLIENCHIEAASGVGGPGVALLDKRPVMIRGCTGNLRVQDASGKTIGMVASGYSQNWTSAAEATAQKIKTAGASL